MNIRQSVVIAIVAGVFLASGGLASAQDNDGPEWSMVSIYHVAPGKQLDFLKWTQQREAIAREAGVAASQWFVHVEGDNWDYVEVAPLTTPEQDRKIEALTKEKGLATGMKAGLEFRTMMLDHTDTMVVGPTTIDEIVKEASK